MIADPTEIKRKIQSYAVDKGAITMTFTLYDVVYSIIIETKRDASTIRNRHDFPWIDQVDEVIFAPFISFEDLAIFKDDLSNIKEITIEEKKYTIVKISAHSEIAGTYLYVVIGVKR